MLSILAATAPRGMAQGTYDRLLRVCGPNDSWQDNLCWTIYRPGGSGRLLAAEVVQWLTATGLSILVILIGAWIVNRLARRCVVKLGRGVGNGRLTRGLSAVRRLVRPSSVWMDP